MAAALLAVTVSGLLVMGQSFKLWLIDVFASSPRNRGDFTIDLRVFRLYWIDEPVLFGVLLVPLTVLAYIAFAAATRLAVVVAAGAGPRREVARRALGFHAVHLVPASFLPAAFLGGLLGLQLIPLVLIVYFVIIQLPVGLARRTNPRPSSGRADRTFNVVRTVVVTLLLAVIVGKYFMLFDSPYFDPIAVPLSRRPDYPFLLGLASLMGLAYVLVTGWLAMKRMAYVNVSE
jgi:hypothetical protein